MRAENAGVRDLEWRSTKAEERPHLCQSRRANVLFTSADDNVPSWPSFPRFDASRPEDFSPPACSFFPRAAVRIPKPRAEMAAPERLPVMAGPRHPRQVRPVPPAPATQVRVEMPRSLPATAPIMPQRATVRAVSAHRRTNHCSWEP